MTKSEKRKIIKAIRHKVVSTHWIKGNYQAPVGQEDGSLKTCWCLVGMINIECDLEAAKYNGIELMRQKDVGSWNAPKDHPAHHTAVLIWGAINRLHPKTRQKSIEEWNDQKSRKRKDVVAVLDAVLEDLA